MNPDAIRLLFLLKGSARQRGMATGIENLAWRLAATGFFRVRVLVGGRSPEFADTEANLASFFPPDGIAYVYADTHPPLRSFRRRVRQEIQDYRPHFVIGWIRLISPHINHRCFRRQQPVPFFVANEGEDLRGKPRVDMLRRVWRTRARSLLGLVPLARSHPRNLPVQVVAITPAVAQSVVECYRVSPERVSVIPRGIDTEVFTHPHSNVMRSTSTVVTHGNVIPTKGHHKFAAALQHVSVPCKWRVIGTGDSQYASDIQELVEGTHHSVEFMATLNHSDLAEELRRSSIFVLLSTAEGAGKALLEAMASGCVCIVSDIPAFAGVVSDGETAIVARPTSEGLAVQVEHILRNPSQYELMRLKARNEILEGYSVSAEVGPWTNLLLAMHKGLSAPPVKSE